MRRALILLAALTLGAAPLSAQATTAPTLTLAQQAKKADVIVRATLGTSTSVKDGAVTWLVYPLTITETVAGDPASLPQLEGKPALYLLPGVEGLPELRAGQEAFLLLYSKRLDSPVVGFTQGLYPIENGKVTRPGADTSANVGTGTEANPSPATTPSTTPSPATASSPATTPSPAATATPSTPTPGPSPSTGAANPTTPGTPATTSPAPAPGNTSPGTASTPVPTDPNATLTDPAKFRDALRAAREAK